jgi:formylglycine-generating enzyme required for sulfatase activity/serine/threonine protein kinase
MDDSISPSAASSNADETVVLPPPVPSDLIRQNAGRILGDMLNEGIAGTEREGDSIGPYRLCEIIGEGGFGNVWRAEQTEVVRREVALKVIKLGMDTAQVLGRFNQERQALASLEHPNIATMLDAGVGPNGRPYFAMELVRGGSITRWCQDHEVALPERLRLFIQVCQAVQHAHEKGILHRDIKPSNVLVTEVDGAPVPKVIDFGIAKAMSGSQAELSLLTQTGQVIGTPLYMSPEQVEGGELDARCDVHALGTLLYELLTGMAPFSPESAGKASADEIRKAILETYPERPNTRLRRQRKLTTQDRSKTHSAERLSTLPADLDWITMRALEKCRERRYASAAELAADVQRHLDSLPVLARPPSLTYAAGRWLRRHRRRCLAGAAVVLSSLAAAALSMHWAKEPEIPFPDPLPPAEVARRSVTNSLGMKFVPVPGIDALFCIHETRRCEYAAYAAAVPGVNAQWKDVYETSPTLSKVGPGLKDDHPVVMVSWDDANGFCQWLSRVEGRTYRLPTDAEWSAAAGLRENHDQGGSPLRLSSNPERTQFPWGTHFPPRANDLTGNYADDAWAWAFPDRPSIPGYNDGFPTIAPVMSFKPNPYGLYDLSGNVLEACSNWMDGHRRSRVSRGGCFHHYETTYLRLTERFGIVSPPGRFVYLGFRCVLDVKASPVMAASKPAAPLAKAAVPTTQPQINSLGMKFVPVPGTKVLFCIHETRRQDYAAFADTRPGLSTSWQNADRAGVPAGHLPDHPVVMVSWNNANAFCEWLSQKESRAYRLPTDREWSLAAGLGKEDAPAGDPCPEALGMLNIVSFPWGGSFPPRTADRAGNYADTVWHETFDDRPWIADYTDGYATTAPVMSFKPNALGLFDMGGNVNEWCLDLYTPGRQDRVTRGGSFIVSSFNAMRSSHRGYDTEGIPRNASGFRVVLEQEAKP